MTKSFYLAIIKQFEIIKIIVYEVTNNMSTIGIIVLLILSGILIPVFVLSQTGKTTGDIILDKDFSGSLKGIFAVYIALGHLVLISETTYPLLMPLKNFGYLCVAFFFLMSGYGLTLGYLRGGLKDFAKKRVLKIYIPYVISSLIIGFLYLAFMDDVKVLDIFIKSLLMKPVYADRILWYVFVQVLMYIFFWISFKFIPEKKNNLFKLLGLLGLTLAYIVVCKVIHESLWRYKTVLCFPLGVFVGLYKDQVISLIKKYFAVFVVPAIPVCAVGFAFAIMDKHSFITSLVSALLFACLAVFVSYKVSIRSKILHFLGDISYEFYIFQLPIIHITLKNIDSKIDYLYPIIIIIVTTLLAYCAHLLSDFICKKITAPRH